VNDEAILLRGGPFNGTRLSSEEGISGALVELESDGLINRYIPTTHIEEVDGEHVVVYQFDGVVAIDGGAPGTEDPQQRMASPLADELREDRSE
jgi:hypothetical protein